MSRLLSLGVLLAAAVAVASPAHAQTLDVLTQDVLLDVVGPDLRIEVTLTAVADESWEGVPILTPGLPIDEARVDDQAVAPEPHPDYPDLVTVLPVPGGLSSEPREIRYVLQGAPDCTAGGYLVCEHDAAGTVLLPSSIDMAWHYVGLYGPDTFTGAVAVRAPSDRVVLAGQGAPVSVTDGGDGTSVTRFVIDLPTEHVWVFARAADEVVAEGGAVRGYVADASADGAVMQRMVDLAAGVRPVYEQAFGVLPVDELHLMTVPTGFPFGGMGMLGNVLLGDFILLGDFDYLVDQGIAHEVAHTWWGGLTSALHVEEGMALQEGLAEYSAWLALGELWGDDARTAGSRMNAVWYMYGRPGPVDVAPLDEDAQRSPVAIHVAYHKASTVYRTLEEAAGREAFEAALARLIQLGPSGLTVAGLEEAVLAESGVDVSPLVDQWLRSPGYPQLDVRGTLDGEEACVEVEMFYDFAFELPVVVRGRDGSATEHRVFVREGGNQACVPAGEDAVAVEIDPRWTLVRQARPAAREDVTLDGRTDAADLIEVALRVGTGVPAARRIDGGYDPFFDVDLDLDVDDADLEAVATAAR